MPWMLICGPERASGMQREACFGLGLCRSAWVMGRPFWARIRSGLCSSLWVKEWPCWALIHPSLVQLPQAMGEATLGPHIAFGFLLPQPPAFPDAVRALAMPTWHRKIQTWGWHARSPQLFVWKGCLLSLLHRSSRFVRPAQNQEDAVCRPPAATAL